ncbi:MAG: hypothetical protein PF482_01480 [Desulfobacteraceae bacterium]|nr:hypothetical protein [Desulfobacteraceae bacterium]
MTHKVFWDGKGFQSSQDYRLQGAEFVCDRNTVLDIKLWFDFQ